MTVPGLREDSFLTLLSLVDDESVANEIHRRMWTAVQGLFAITEGSFSDPVSVARITINEIHWTSLEEHEEFREGLRGLLDE